MPLLVLIALAAWFLAVLFVLALLTMAKRADEDMARAAAEAAGETRPTPVDPNRPKVVCRRRGGESIHRAWTLG